MADPVRLLDYVGSPHAKRYTDAEREAAYDCWKLAAGRSLRKAGEILGISASTLGTWSQEHGWARRAAKEDAAELASVRSSIAAKVTAELDKNIETAKEIRDDKDAAARDRLAAAQWLSGIAGVAPVAKGDGLHALASPSEPAGDADREDLRGLSPAELMKAEQRFRERQR